MDIDCVSISTPQWNGKWIKTIFHIAQQTYCRNAKELHCVGLHWHVPFIEVLSETVQVVW